MRDNLDIIRKKIKSNKPSVGAWMQIPSSDIAELFCAVKKFDWITLDLEHGNFLGVDFSNIIRAIEKFKKIPLVRLSNKNQENLSEILDAGIRGFIIPMIDNRKDLEKVISRSFYPPLGNRGVGFSRSNGFGKSLKKNLTFRPLIIAMIENKSALTNIDEILSTKYLDGIFIGPYDLSASLGVTGKFKSKIFLNALKMIRQKCIKKKCAFGIHIINPDFSELSKKKNQGYNFLAFSMDSVLIRSSLSNLK
jgi:2-dehydro-3-deoxyglucarate aldolase